MPFNITTKHIVLSFFAVGIGVWLWQAFAPRPPAGGPMVEVAVPTLSPVAQRGEAAFSANCATCHGRNAAGSKNGPPLVHAIYNPGHHADEAFHLAAKRGVRSHHWRFGDMPPQPQVTERQLADIVRYVREVQAANGIKYEPHRM